MSVWTTIKKAAVKAGSTVLAAEEAYTTRMDRVEKRIMVACGSDHMMEEALNDAIDSGITHVKDSAVCHKVIDTVRDGYVHAHKTVCSTTSTVVSTVREKAVLVKDKYIPKDKAVPMARPVPHVDGSHAPLSGMPVVEYKPARPSMRGHMQSHVHKGTCGAPMATVRN